MRSMGPRRPRWCASVRAVSPVKQSAGRRAPACRRCNCGASPTEAARPSAGALEAATVIPPCAGSEHRCLTPGQLLHVRKRRQQCRAVPHAVITGVFAAEAAERAQIEVIHVRVGEQQQIERRQLGGLERARDVALGPEGDRADAHADPRKKDRVGENPEAEEIDQHRGVAEPGGGQASSGQARGVGWCGAGKMARPASQR